MNSKRVSTSVAWIMALGAVLFLPVPSLFAQNVSATLTGTVTDSSGAVVPKADVTLKNESSGDIRHTLSNTDGYFTFAAIPPGSYTIEVDLSGFQKWQATQVVLNAGDKRNLSDIVMQLGTTKETVTVEATNEPITPVDSGDKSAVINQKTMSTVAIIGQNAAEFIKIMPGMAMTSGAINQSSYGATDERTGNGPVSNFSANGMRTAAMDITADGAHIIDPGCNCGQSVNTNVDMTEELKVDMQSFGADSAKGPTVVNAIGKSGGAHFHGELYLYARDYVMNANDSLENAAGTSIPQTRYLFPGGNIGGPVVIPGTNFNHNHDKLFFFYGMEYYDQLVDNGVYEAVVPTAAMRAGDFSTASNPYMSKLNGYAVTGQPNFAGGIVPAADISPYGTALMNVYPLPNTTPSAANNSVNYVSASTRSSNMWQFRPRVDYSINDNTKLYVSWNRQRDNAQESLDTLWTGNAQSWVSPTVPYPTPIVEKTQSDAISVGLTKVMGPTLTNEMIFTYTYLNLPNSFQNPAKVERGSLGLTYQMAFNHQNQQNLIFPQMTGWSDGIANELNAGFELNGVVFAKKTLPNFADNLSKVWGTHTAKFGFYWERTWNSQPGDGDVNGQMAFANWGGNSTGNAYADMLAGRIASYGEQNFDTTPAFRYMSADFYAQDSWKVSRRLTLEYGIRIQHLGPWADLSGYGFPVFLPADYAAGKGGVNGQFPGYEWNKIDPSIPSSGSPSRRFYYNPRIGFAYDIFGSGRTVLRGGFGIYHYHDEQNVQGASYGVTQGEFGASISNATYANLNTASAQAPSAGPALDTHDDQQPRVMNYSFTIAERMPWHSVLEAAYVGNKGDYLSNYNNNIGNIDLLPIGSLFSAYGWLPGNYSSAQENSIRPYPAYSSIKIITHDMYSNYNSLQVTWNKQTGRLNFLTNYTFSKALGIRGENGAAVGNPYNVKDEYGTLPNNRTHILNAAYTYQIPEISTGNKFAKSVVNGWMISGITQVQSGADLQAAISSNFNFSYYVPAGTTFMGTTATSAFQAANTTVFGTPDITLEPLITCDPRKGLKPNQFINPSCFAPPGIGTNGNYIFPALTGPWFWESDLSLFKTFTFKESQKIELRGSAYNFLNHPLNTFINGDQNLNLGFNQQGQLTNPNFGTASHKTDHRIMQLAIKYIF